MQISLGRLNQTACEDIRGQVGPATLVTPIAATYLASGQLPGNWGNRFKNAGRFWPYH